MFQPLRDQKSDKMCRGPRVGDEITLTATIQKVMEDGVSSVLAIDTPKKPGPVRRSKLAILPLASMMKP